MVVGPKYDPEDRSLHTAHYWRKLAQHGRDDTRDQLLVFVGFQRRRRGGELARHLEVHDVTGVVLHDVQHAGTAVDDLGRLLHLVGRRRGEDLTGACGVKHAESDESAVQRLSQQKLVEPPRHIGILHMSDNSIWYGKGYVSPRTVTGTEEAVVSK